MQKQCVPFLLVLLVVFSTSACSTRSNSANVQSLDQRLNALEEKVFNQEEKQQSINDWTAKRLGALEAQHPNLQVPPPPGFMQKETIRPNTSPEGSDSLPPAPGEVVDTVPGQASITPGKPPTPKAAAPVTYHPPAASAQNTTPPPAAAPIVQVDTRVTPQPTAPASSQAASLNSAPQTNQNMEKAEAKAQPAAAQNMPAEEPKASERAKSQANNEANNQGNSQAPKQAPKQAQPPAQPQAQQQSPAPKTAASQTPAATSDKAAYAAALSLLEKGKTEQGLAAMDNFLLQFPQSPLVPNAMYWKGEALYTQLKFDEAILSFKDVVTKYTKTNKAPDALLKIGMSYQRLADNDNAKFYLQMLLEDYPDARSAALAKKHLAALNK